MAKLTVRFEGSCLFLRRPGKGIDACFLSNEHHRTVLVLGECAVAGLEATAVEFLLRGCAVEVLFDGRVAPQEDTRVAEPGPLDVRECIAEARVHPELQKRDKKVPECVDARLLLAGGVLTAGFTDTSLRHTWLVPGAPGARVLSDAAEFTVQHEARRVKLRLHVGKAELIIPIGGPTGDASFTIVTRDTSGLDEVPQPGFPLAEFAVLYAGLHPETIPRSRTPVPTLVRRLEPDVAPALRIVSRPGRPICPNGTITVK